LSYAESAVFSWLSNLTVVDALLFNCSKSDKPPDSVAYASEEVIAESVSAPARTAAAVAIY
jgi:hypothetical protein